MIPKNRHLLLFVCLTLVLLAACEPLAPEQTPQYVVVTGETAAPLVEATPAVAGTGSPVTPSPTGPAAQGASLVGAVNTPLPSATPLPSETPIPSATPYLCAEQSGQVITALFPSSVAGGDVEFRMYLPPCFYDTLKRYPYVILLHGTGFDDTMWEELGVATDMDQGISKGTLPPMVLVMPDGGYAFELNDQPVESSYEAIILNELVPALESQFCVWSGRQGRAIGGISRGGFWAFSIALRHPEIFSTVGGHSPHFEVDNAPPEINPLDVAAGVNPGKFPLRIYMDNGADDYVGPNAALMAQTLRDHGLAPEYIINPTGDHEMSYWQAHVSEYLAFYGEAWPRDVNALPSCLEPSPQ